MHEVDVGRDAIVRNAIVDKNVRVAPGAQDRRRPGGRSRALPHLRRRDRRDRQRRSGWMPDLRVALLTREYPPEVYGGAGVHVEYLARELARLVDVTVHAWGADRPRRGPASRRSSRTGPGTRSRGPSRTRRRCGRSRSTWRWPPASRARTSCTATPGTRTSAATWRASCTAIPHVATVHSLEPMRPWKAEQLGGGYAALGFCRADRARGRGRDHRRLGRDARRPPALYPAIDPARVSVIHNGIDTDEYRPDPATAALERHGIDPARPSVVFVGRITRQKGLAHLLDAAELLDPHVQLVLVAGAPDTPEIGAEIGRPRRAAARRPRRRRSGSPRWLPRGDVIQLLSHASVFVCPSVYEPLGIVNLEAMACEAPVVATRDGRDPRGGRRRRHGPARPVRAATTTARASRSTAAAFAREIAERVDELLASPERAAALGRAGRARASSSSAGRPSAARTAELYRRLLA